MTIISNSHRFVFVHLHKCGGSSVETAYQPHARWNDLVLGSTTEGEALQGVYQKLHGLHKHNTAAELADRLPEIWDDYWTFSMIRHPAATYESFYRWIHKILSYHGATNDMTLDEVKRRVLAGEVKRPFMAYEVTRPFCRADDFSDFVRRFSKKSTLGTLFDRLSRGGRLIVNDVFKLEQSDRLWAALSARAGVAIDPAHANKGSKLDDLVWGREAVNLVNDLHAIDYETFGYDPK
jgi:hypothetical protein